MPLACALVRRSAYDAVGGLDERYVFYFEDYDLCWRLAAARPAARRPLGRGRRPCRRRLLVGERPGRLAAPLPDQPDALPAQALRPARGRLSAALGAQRLRALRDLDRKGDRCPRAGEVT